MAELFLLWTDPLFRKHVQPLLAAVEAARSTRGRPEYTTEELERLRVFLLAGGNRNYESRNGVGVRDLLTGDRAEIRDALGFNRPRGRSSRKRVRRAGVPAGARLTAHIERVNDWARRIAYESVFKGVLRRHLELFRDELTVEARVLHMDGVAILIRGTCPIYDENGERVNPKVTCEDGGYLAKSSGVSKPGHGFVLVPLTTGETGLPLSYYIGRRNASERTLGRIVLRQFGRYIIPLLGNRGISILTTDSNFHSWQLRTLCRRLGIIENISLSSHKHRKAADEDPASSPALDPENPSAETARRRKEPVAKKAKAKPTSAEKRNQAEIEIEGYPNWYANRHREIFCKCGNGTTMHRCHIGANGYAYAAVEGTCEHCGHISIQSGNYRLAQNPDTFRICHPNDPARVRDWAFGNPLTFNDALARVYGSKRFGQNEGFNSALGSRYGLTRKRRYRNIDQVRADVAIVFTLIHLITMLQRSIARTASLGEMPESSTS